MRLTYAMLTAIMPRIDASVWAGPLNEAMDLHAIVTPERAAVFLAQIAHESDECRRLVENLNYTAARICQVWPRRFPTSETAAPYAKNPEKLANVVYANRMGNGDPASGDGWRFRGRGLIQLTGRSMYRAAGASLQLALEAMPDRVEEPMIAALTAAWFFDSRGCNQLADGIPAQDDEDFIRITKIINGGTHGLPSRRAYWTRAQQALAA